MQLTFGFAHDETGLSRPRDVRHLLTVHSSPCSDAGRPEGQLSFSLTIPCQKVVPFASRKNQFYLDYAVHDFLSGTPEGPVVVRCLSRWGILLVGDLVQCSKYTISRIIPKIPGLVERIDAELAHYGLSFGMRLTAWRRPHTLFRLEA